MPNDQDTVYGLDAQSFKDVGDVVQWFFETGMDKRLGGAFRRILSDTTGEGATYIGPYALQGNSEGAIITVLEGYVNIGTGSHHVPQTDIPITIDNENPWYISVVTKRLDSVNWENSLQLTQTRPTQEDEDGTPVQRVILGKVIVVYDSEEPENSYIGDIEQWWQAGDIFVYDRLVT